MHFQHLNDLKVEMKKYAGFMNPEQVRVPSNEAVKHLSDENICLPIDNPRDPVVLAFTLILDNKKTNKNCAQLIRTMCNCLKSEVITGDALSTIVRKLENFNEIDEETALKIIQFTTLIISNHFLEMHIFQSILSLILSYCTSYNELVSTSAIAAAGQIVSSFFLFARDKKDTLTTVNKRDIDLCFSMSCDKSISFDNHIYKVTYLVIRDFVRLACGQSALWLRVQNFKAGVAYEMIENIIKDHYSILTTSDHFERLISESIKASYSQNAPLSFCITSMEKFMALMPDACASLFTSFLGELKKKSSKLVHSLLFFRIFLLRDASIVANFCLKCDKNANLLSSMISSLRVLCEDIEDINPIAISMRRISSDTAPQETDTFIISAPIEITVYFVRSCYKTMNSALKILVSRTWADILLIFQIAASVVTGNSCYLLMQGLHSLVLLTNELMLDDARGSAIASFCTILVTPKGPEADEVKKVAFETVISAIETNTTAFKGHWMKIMTALSEFLWQPSSFDFTKYIPIEQVFEMAQSLFSINDGAVKTREWSMFFITDLLIANMSRFEKIWPSVLNNFVSLMESAESQEPSLAAFFKLLREGFTSESEKPLCETLKMVLSSKKFSSETRGEILEQIHFVLSQSSQVISGGWSSLLDSLRPENFKDEENILNSAFRCVQIICNDLMFSLSQEAQMHIINLIIDFASQTTDINVSLSALGLFWNLASIAKTPEMWKLIFMKTAPIIADQRNDVSVCAVNTFFSLIISNSELLTEEIYQYLASDLFTSIVDSLVEPREESEATQQLAFHELAHCGRTLWSKFKDVEIFPDQFWQKMISEHEKFIYRCKKREIVLNSFLFYEELFMNHELSPQIITITFDSLDRIVDFLLSHESANSPVFGSFGRLIRNAMPEQKSMMTVDFLKRWIKISERLIFELDRDGFLPPTAHKSLDAFLLLFPLPDEMIVLIYESFVKISSKETKNKRLVEIAISHLCDICENNVPDSLLSTLFMMSESLFTLKEARRLLLDFVSKDIPISDSMVEDVSRSLMSLGESDGELYIKTAQCVLKMFSRVQDQTKLNFVSCYENCYTALEELWKNFLDPSSKDYDDHTAELLTTQVVQKVGNILMKSESDDLIKQILNFVQTVKTNGKFFKKDGNFSHLFVLLQNFADLVMHPDTEIRQMIRNIIIIIYERK